ncbi:hypothetical protein [Aquimarina agarivorans]|uniref:hypothetical protein n=1 Tax=Aquimarina agarivorans TaxID=980584 RepID=UPI000248EA66|nr:hypothetical protein [Aquimarina agarivorans]
MRNEIFNFKRFSNLLKQVFYEKGKSLMVAIGVLIFISLFILRICVLEPELYIVFRWILFFILVYGGSHAFIFIIYKQLFKSKIKTVSLLSLPNSKFEKSVFQNVVIVIGSSLLFFIIFKIMDTSFWYIMEDFKNEAYTKMLNAKVHINHKILFNNRIGYFFLLLNYLFALYYMLDISLGELAKRFRVWLLPILYMPLNYVLNYLFFKDTMTKNSWVQLPFTEFNFVNNLEKYEDYVIRSGLDRFEIAIFVILPMIMLLLSINYFKLKEKEV